MVTEDEFRAQVELAKSGIRLTPNSANEMLAEGHEALTKARDELMEEERIHMNRAFDMIMEQLDYWMDMPLEARKVVAIWIIGTYIHDGFNTYPYLFLNAMRGSGKTRLLRLISHLGNKGDGTIQNDMKEAVLFRMQRNKVLCIDEFENVGAKDKATLRSVLNAAYKKGLKIVRMRKAVSREGEKYVPDEFEPFMPICMANIWGMEEVLGDRSITLTLEKSSDYKTKLIETFDKENPAFLEIKKELFGIPNSVVVSCRYVKNYIESWNSYVLGRYRHDNDIDINDTKRHYDIKLDEIFNKIDSKGLIGRNFELAFPLLITAYVFNEKLFEELLDILSVVFTEKQREEFAESKDVQVYDFVSQQSEYRFNFIALRELVSRFRQYIGDQDQEDQWLNEKWMGRALKRLKLQSQMKRMSNGRLVTLDVDKAKEKVLIFKKVQKDEVET